MAVSTSGLVANSRVFTQFSGNLYMKGKYHTYSKMGIPLVLFSLVEKQQKQNEEDLEQKCCLIIKDLAYGRSVKYLS